MIICPKCEGILDPNDPSKVERKYCTGCVRNGALAEDTPTDAIEKAVAEDNKRFKKVNLKMEYIWLDDEWRVNLAAKLPGGHNFNIVLSREQLEGFLADMKELENDKKAPPAG